MSEWIESEEWIVCPHCDSDDARLKLDRTNIRVTCPECGEGQILHSMPSSL